MKRNLRSGSCPKITLRSGRRKAKQIGTGLSEPRVRTNQEDTQLSLLGPKYQSWEAVDRRRMKDSSTVALVVLILLATIGLKCVNHSRFQLAGFRCRSNGYGTALEPVSILIMDGTRQDV